MAGLYATFVLLGVAGMKDPNLYEAPSSPLGCPDDPAAPETPTEPHWSKRQLSCFLLLVLPVPIALLFVYRSLEGQIKLPGLILLALFILLLECIALFICRSFLLFRHYLCQKQRR
jgi:hypothetical protein